MVWIRIPSLNLVYYDESLLWALASLVGTPVKVDLHTLNVARGRFARICVEVDLTKPVVGCVGINGEWYQVQYEGLHIICTQCGCYGHLMKDCATRKNGDIAEEKQIGDNVNKNTAVQQEKLENDGAAANVTNEMQLINKDDTVVDLAQNSENFNNESARNQKDNDNKCDPELVHGDWICVERKKRSNKLNRSNFGGVSMGENMMSHHSKKKCV
jgi:hypothetical protein